MANKPTDAGTLLRPPALIIFVDIRGFSQWSKEIDAHESTLKLVDEFQAILKKHFDQFSSKALGDGAMLVKQISLNSRKDILREIESIAERAKRVEAEFAKVTQDIAIVSGNPADLVLGWGITRGQVIKQTDGQTDDFLGHHVNKAARLCDLARPNGMVIDRDDFFDPPKKYRNSFYPQVKRLLKPYQEVKVWVSKEINETFQAREFLRETPEVHVAGVCVRSHSGSTQILIARRSANRSFYPNKWEGCGGQLRYSESFYDGVKRHYFTEMQVEVDVLRYVSPEIYTIEKPAEPVVPGLRFLCKYVGGEPTSPNHDECQWVSLDEFDKMPTEDFPPHLKEQAVKLIERYKKHES